MKTNFAVIGAAGKMGCNIIALSTKIERNGRGLNLSGALENSSSPLIGKDAGRIAAQEECGVKISSDPKIALQEASVVIDFSSPKSTLQAISICREKKIPYVVGTTGFTNEEYQKLQDASRDIPLLPSSNMSLGANLLFYLAEVSAEILGEAFDTEIAEIHHHLKKDAPSGTAVQLKDLITPSKRKGVSVIYGRKGMVGARSPEEIGIHSLRGGDTVGDHTVFFLGKGERIELTHRAFSRDSFASGALQAALFLSEKGREPRLYTMKEVLDKE